MSIIILVVYFGLEHGLPCIRAWEGMQDGKFLICFCWLSAVESIARKKPPGTAPGSSSGMDKSGHLLRFPCLSAPCKRSNIYPQQQFCSSWSVLWTMQCYIWFTHKPVAQAEPPSPELAPNARREEKARQRDNNNNQTEMPQGQEWLIILVLSISWSLTSL